MKKVKRNINNVKNSTKKIIAGGAFALTCVTIPMVATQASTVYQAFNTTVGSFNGNGYTGYLSKTNSGTNANVRNFSAGGGYSVRVRMQSSSANGAWTGYQSSGSFNVSAHSDHGGGTSVRLNFNNRLTTPVSVQVQGDWRPN